MKFRVKSGDHFEIDLKIDPPKTIHEVVTNKVFCFFMGFVALNVFLMIYGYKTGDYRLYEVFVDCIMTVISKL